jgi:hypothetical protein
MATTRVRANADASGRPGRVGGCSPLRACPADPRGRAPTRYLPVELRRRTGVRHRRAPVGRSPLVTFREATSPLTAPRSRILSPQSSTCRTSLPVIQCFAGYAKSHRSPRLRRRRTPELVDLDARRRHCTHWLTTAPNRHRSGAGGTSGAARPLHHALWSTSPAGCRTISAVMHACVDLLGLHWIRTEQAILSR